MAETKKFMNVYLVLFEVSIFLTWEDFHVVKELVNT